MRLKNILISLLAVAIVIILPHSGVIPLPFAYTIPVLLFVWLYLRHFGENFSNIGFNFKSFNFKAVLIGSLAAIVILTFLQLVFFPILETFIDFDDPEVELYEFIRENAGNYIFILAMGWVVGGFYEEIVFHGFIFSRLEKMMPGKYATLISFILTSILFGAYHIQLGAADATNALLAGAGYLALALYFKRNLWYSIICHGVYDTIVITLIYIGYF